MRRKEIVLYDKYVSYEDAHEIEETHDVLQMALPGQSYLVEKLNKVNTNQVTGEALKKIALGGKGGMGSQGDARDQDKQVDASSRVMVLSPPSQEAFDYNVSLDKVAVRFGDGTVEYLYQGESYTSKTYCPSRIFGEKDVKGWIETTKRLGRDYDDFSHTAQWDASDWHRKNEEFLTGESLEWSRRLYDELCGYKGAWKYVGLEGREHRRYRISIVNTLNLPLGKYYPSRYCELEQKAEWHKRNPEEAEKKAPPSWGDELSVARHHKNLYKAANRLWMDGDEEAFDKWMVESNNDHAYYVMWSLGKLKQHDWWPKAGGMVKYAGCWRDEESLKYPAQKLIRAEDESMDPDVKSVYLAELTKRGKMKYVEASPKLGDNSAEVKRNKHLNRLR